MGTAQETLEEDGHVYCATCPRYLRRDLAEKSDLWERDGDGWACEYCTVTS